MNIAGVQYGTGGIVKTQARENGEKSLSFKDEMDKVSISREASEKASLFYNPQDESSGRVSESSEIASAAPGGDNWLRISLKDPWGSKHPLRQDANEFLKIFENMYRESLAAMNIKPETNGSVILSKDETESLMLSVADGLNADPEAKRLMKVLNISFPVSQPVSQETALAEPALQPGEILDSAGRINIDAWRQKYQEAVKEYEMTGKKNILLLRNPDNWKNPIKGATYAVDFSKKGVSQEDALEYAFIFKKHHDEVVRELGMEDGSYQADSPEGRQALKMMGERIMADPEAQKLIKKLGLTAVNDQGLPTAPGHEHMPEDYSPIDSRDFWEFDFYYPDTSAKKAAGNSATESDLIFKKLQAEARRDWELNNGGRQTADHKWEAALEIMNGKRKS